MKVHHSKRLRELNALDVTLYTEARARYDQDKKSQESGEKGALNTKNSAMAFSRAPRTY